MRISLKIEDERGIKDIAEKVAREHEFKNQVNSASFPAYHNALRVMAELIRDASLDLTVWKAAVYHSFPSYFHETG